MREYKSKKLKVKSKIIGVAASVLLLGAGCEMPSIDAPGDGDSDASMAIVLPVEKYIEYRYSKPFGEEIHDRFDGYHVADDVEFEFVAEEVPVYAMLDGTVVQIGDVSGYGGMLLIDHGGVNAIYGHIDLGSATVKAGDAVTRGQFLANLGENRSAETDGERKHLHFGLYAGEPTRINGYEPTAAAVYAWINPHNFFSEKGIDMTTPERAFTATDLGGDVFHFEFTVPEGMEVEYIHSLQALNVFTLAGDGTARDRSQMLIRYFDAAEFQTLTTVDVLSTTELTVGKGDYTARRYEIVKKSGVANFADQPVWRNAQHMVTDFTAAEPGETGRYYVVAANPALASEIYEDFLASITITE